jgi:hypothetical protein
LRQIALKKDCAEEISGGNCRVQIDPKTVSEYRRSRLGEMGARARIVVADKTGSDHGGKKCVI